MVFYAADSVQPQKGGTIFNFSCTSSEVVVCFTHFMPPEQSCIPPAAVADQFISALKGASLRTIFALQSYWLFCARISGYFWMKIFFHYYYLTLYCWVITEDIRVFIHSDQTYIHLQPKQVHIWVCSKKCLQLLPVLFLQSNPPKKHVGKAAKASKAVSSLTHRAAVFSQSLFMALLLPIYGNQSRKQMFPTAFQTHPEKCKQCPVSACFWSKTTRGCVSLTRRIQIRCF